MCRETGQKNISKFFFLVGSNVIILLISYSILTGYLFKKKNIQDKCVTDCCDEVSCLVDFFSWVNHLQL